MPSLIAFGFFLEITLERFLQIDSRLISNTNKYKHYISQFIFEFHFFIGFLERLFTLFSCRDARNVTNFFHQHGRVCKFTEITNAVFFYPSVDSFLRFGNGHNFYCYCLNTNGNKKKRESKLFENLFISKVTEKKPINQIGFMIKNEKRFLLWYRNTRGNGEFSSSVPLIFLLCTFYSIFTFIQRHFFTISFCSYAITTYSF